MDVVLSILKIFGVVAMVFTLLLVLNFVTCK